MIAYSESQLLNINLINEILTYCLSNLQCLLINLLRLHTKQVYLTAIKHVLNNCQN